MLMRKMIFGCGRLTGGATEREAVDLIRICLDVGIRHFDTAPSYGIGTAERVVGKAISGCKSKIVLGVKVGSRPDKNALLKTYVRKIKRMLSSSEPLKHEAFAPPLPAGGLSSAILIRMQCGNSLRRSQENLRRDQFDYVFLHEAYAGDMSLRIGETLSAMVSAEYLRKLGYANGAILNMEIDATFPANYVAQTAIKPELLLGTEQVPWIERIFHSIVKTGWFLQRTNAKFAQSLALAGNVMGGCGGDTVSHEIVAIYTLLNARYPEVGLVFSSANAERLKSVLVATEWVDRHNAAQEIAEKFGHL